jgi:hypothetical protein
VRNGLTGGGHADPFARTLSRDLDLSRWARRHRLIENGQPLRLTLNRLKTTVERRTTRAVGGHLPSAVRTNTQDVLFASYLASDPTVRDWADGVVAEALVDAEDAARAAHQRITKGNGGPIPIVQADAETRATSTVFASCRDIDNSPFNEGTCRASFLTCFACRNAVVTTEHLPPLVDLLDELNSGGPAHPPTGGGAATARHGCRSPRTSCPPSPPLRSITPAPRRTDTAPTCSTCLRDRGKPE